METEDNSHMSGDGMAKGNIPMWEDASVKLNPMTKAASAGLLLTLPEGYKPSPSVLAKALEGATVASFEAEVASVRSYADRDYIARLEAENRRLSTDLQNSLNSVAEPKKVPQAAVDWKTLSSNDLLVLADALSAISAKTEDESIVAIVGDMIEHLGIQELSEVHYQFILDVTLTSPYLTSAQVLGMINDGLRDELLGESSVIIVARPWDNGHCC